MRATPFAGLLLALCRLAGACAAPAQSGPPVLAAPELTSSVEHHRGTPLGGVSATQVLPRALETAWAVKFEVLYLERAPELALVRLRSRARLVSAQKGGAPIETASLLAERGRVAVGDVARG